MSVSNMSVSPRTLLTAAILMATIAASTQQRIDCRRFVFAPICRGVAAKRSEGGMRILHSVQPIRTDYSEENYVQPTDEPASADVQGPEAAALERFQFLRQRALRDRKVVRSRNHERLYLPPRVKASSTDTQEYDY